MFAGRREAPCRKVRDMLSEYIDSRLSGESKSFVENHLNTCEACSKELESLRTTVLLLHKVPEVAVPRSFAVTAPRRRREIAFGASNLRWLRPATAIVAIAFVALLVGDVFDAFDNNGQGNQEPISVAVSGAGITAFANPEQQVMVDVPGIMGQMSLATAKSVGYGDYTQVRYSANPEQRILVTVPGVMGQMSLAAAKAAGFSNYTVTSSVPSSLVAQLESSQDPPAVDSGRSGAAEASAVVEDGTEAGWPLRQIEIGLGAAVLVLVALIIFARRQRTKRVLS